MGTWYCPADTFHLFYKPPWQKRVHHEILPVGKKGKKEKKKEKSEKEEEKKRIKEKKKKKGKKKEKKNEILVE